MEEQIDYPLIRPQGKQRTNIFYFKTGCSKLLRVTIAYIRIFKLIQINF